MAGPPPQQNHFLGAPIKVVTTFGEELEGELYCYDVSGSNSFVLRRQLPNGSTSYKWVRSNVIREVQALGPPRPVDGTLPALDLKKLEERVEREANKFTNALGAGATEHAQAVFNAMARTLDCEWDKEDIMCLGVRISSPYVPESCAGGNDPVALERVQKGLQGELDKMKQMSIEGGSGSASSFSLMTSMEEDEGRKM